MQEYKPLRRQAKVFRKETDRRAPGKGHDFFDIVLSLFAPSDPPR
jgi:hypothetical protein